MIEEELIIDDARSDLEKRIIGLSILQDRIRHFAVDGILIIILHLLLRELLFKALIQTKIFDQFNYALVLLILLYFSYYLFFEGVFGRTIGHFLNKTIPLTEEQEKIGMKQAIIRLLVRPIPFGFALMIFPISRTLHDFLSKTYVVRIR